MNTETNDSTEFRQKPDKLKHEFHRHKFRLHHHAYEDFHRSQWQTKPTSWAFLIYRWLLAIFFNVGVATCIYFYFLGGRWFIYLTNWGFMLCGITSTTGAICLSIYHKHPEGMVQRVCIIKCYWACYWTNLIIAYVIGIVYWGAIHFKKGEDDDRGDVSTVYNLWTHAMPSLLFTVDHMIVAQPSRILHFIYPFFFGLIYGIFTIIYYLLGGLDVRDRTYIYSMLNHAIPHQSLGTMALITLLIIACSTFHYGLYRLRVFIAGKLKKLQ
ncbi:protein rolling stone [Drosophila willistoni]|uniref:protein rolling stone n=1 Tax=Drosophila willistoni TaxID=7260 RepID=UPI00017D7994|nr:protein rolling stone [Drosophila willistoni]